MKAPCWFMTYHVECGYGNPDGLPGHDKEYCMNCDNQGMEDLNPNIASVRWHLFNTYPAGVPWPQHADKTCGHFTGVWE